MAAAASAQQLRLPLRLHGHNADADGAATGWSSAGAAAAAGHSTQAAAAASSLPPAAPLAPHLRLLLAAEFRRKHAWQSAGQAAQASAYTQRFGRTEATDSTAAASAASAAAATVAADGGVEPFLLLPSLLRLAPPPSVPLDFRSVGCLWALDRRRTGAATLADLEALAARAQATLRARHPKPQGVAQARAVLQAAHTRAMYEDMCAIDATAAAAGSAATKLQSACSASPTAASDSTAPGAPPAGAPTGGDDPFVHWFLSLLVNAHPTASFKHVGLSVLYLHRASIELLWELLRPMLPRPPAAETAANATLADGDVDGADGGGGGGDGGGGDGGGSGDMGGPASSPAVLVSASDLYLFSPSFSPCSLSLDGAAWGLGVCSFQSFFDLLQRASEERGTLSLEDPLLDHYVPLDTVERLLRLWLRAFKGAMRRVGIGAAPGVAPQPETAVEHGQQQEATLRQRQRQQQAQQQRQLKRARAMASSVARARALQTQQLLASASTPALVAYPDTAAASEPGFGPGTDAGTVAGGAFPSSTLVRVPSFPATLAPQGFITPRTPSAPHSAAAPSSPMQALTPSPHQQQAVASRSVPSAVTGSPSPPRPARHLFLSSPGAPAAAVAAAATAGPDSMMLMQFPSGSPSANGSARGSARGSGSSSERERASNSASARGSMTGISHRATGLQQSLRNIVEEGGMATAGLGRDGGGAGIDDNGGHCPLPNATDGFDVSRDMTATARGLDGPNDQDLYDDAELDDAPLWPLHAIPAIDFGMRSTVQQQQQQHASAGGLELLTPTSQRYAPVRRHPGVPSLSFAPATGGGALRGGGDQPLSGHLGVAMAVTPSWMSGRGSGSSSGHAHSSSMPSMPHTAVSQLSLASSTALLTGASSSGGGGAGASSAESRASSAANSLHHTPLTSPTGSTYAAHLLALNPRRSTGPTFRAPHGLQNHATGGASTRQNSVDLPIVGFGMMSPGGGGGGGSMSKTNGVVPSLALHGLGHPATGPHGLSGGGSFSPVKSASSSVHSAPASASGALVSPLASASRYHTYAYTQRMLGMQQQQQGPHALTVAHVQFSTPQRAPVSTTGVPLLSYRSPLAACSSTFDGPLSSSHAALLSSASKLALRSSLGPGAAHHVHDVSLLSERQLRSLAAGTADAPDGGDDSDEGEEGEDELSCPLVDEEEGEWENTPAAAAATRRSGPVLALQAQFDAHANLKHDSAPAAPRGGTAGSGSSNVGASPPPPTGGRAEDTTAVVAADAPAPAAVQTVASTIVVQAQPPQVLPSAIPAAPAATPAVPPTATTAVANAVGIPVDLHKKSRAASAAARESAGGTGSGPKLRVSVPKQLGGVTLKAAATSTVSSRPSSSKRDAVHGPRLSRQSSSACSSANSSNAPTPTHKGSTGGMGGGGGSGSGSGAASAGANGGGGVGGGAAVAHKKGVTFRMSPLLKTKTGGATSATQQQQAASPSAPTLLAPSSSAPQLVGAPSHSHSFSSPLSLRLPLTMKAPPGPVVGGAPFPSTPPPPQTKPLHVSVDGPVDSSSPSGGGGGGGGGSSAGGHNVHPFGATHSPDSRGEPFLTQLAKGSKGAASKGQQQQSQTQASSDASALIVPKRRTAAATGGRERSPSHPHA